MTVKECLGLLTYLDDFDDINTNDLIVQIQKSTELLYNGNFYYVPFDLLSKTVSDFRVYLCKLSFDTFDIVIFI